MFVCSDPSFSHLNSISHTLDTLLCCGNVHKVTYISIRFKNTIYLSRFPLSFLAPTLFKKYSQPIPVSQVSDAYTLRVFLLSSLACHWGMKTATLRCREASRLYTNCPWLLRVRHCSDTKQIKTCPLRPNLCLFLPRRSGNKTTNVSFDVRRCLTLESFLFLYDLLFYFFYLSCFSRPVSPGFAILVWGRL